MCASVKGSLTPFARGLAYGDLLSLQRLFSGRDEPLAVADVVVAMPRDVVIVFMYGERESGFRWLAAKWTGVSRTDGDKVAIDETDDRRDNRLSCNRRMKGCALSSEEILDGRTSEWDLAGSENRINSGKAQ